MRAEGVSGRAQCRAEGPDAAGAAHTEYHQANAHHGQVERCFPMGRPPFTPMSSAPYTGALMCPLVGVSGPDDSKLRDARHVHS